MVFYLYIYIYEFIMWGESCNIPNSEYLTQEFNIPEEIKEDISWESRSELLDCWLDTLIVCESDILKWKIKDELRSSLLLWLHESNLSLSWINITDPEFWLRNTLEWVMYNLSSKEKFILSQYEMQAVVIWGMSFNYSWYLHEENFSRNEYFQLIYDVFSRFDTNYFVHISEDERTYLEWQVWTTDISNISSYQIIFEELWIVNPVESSFRPSLRPNYASLEYQDATIVREYASLEWDVWFQESTNNWMTLNDALDLYGLSEYVLSTLPVIFNRDLNNEEIEQLILLIKYTTSIESRYGYNLSRDDIQECPSWYFQYQICDWVASKEVYNYETETFSDAWEWWPDDVEIVNHTWEDRAWVRRVWKDSSYDTALRSLPEDIREWNPKFSSDFENIWNPNSQNFSSLNSQEQIILFLSDSRNKQWGEQYFNRIFAWDRTAIVDMYIANHNTNPEDDSERSQNIYWVIRSRAQEILDISYP